MSTTTEVQLGFAWIYSVLSADSTLAGYAPGGVSRSYAQPSTQTPYVIMKHHGSTDAPIFGGSHAYSDMQFEVSAVGPAASMQSILNAAARIDTLLTLANPTAVTGGTILASFRDRQTSDDSLIEGEVWNSTCNYYRIFAKAS